MSLAKDLMEHYDDGEGRELNRRQEAGQTVNIKEEKFMKKRAATEGELRALKGGRRWQSAVVCPGTTMGWHSTPAFSSIPVGPSFHTYTHTHTHSIISTNTVTIPCTAVCIYIKKRCSHFHDCKFQLIPQ